MPTPADPEFERAQALQQKGAWDEAKRAYANVLVRDPGHLGALQGYASLMYEMGHYSAAVKVYQELLLRTPKDPNVHVQRGYALVRLTRMAEARAHFEAAVALEPGHKTAHQGLAAYYMHLRDFARAEEHGRIAFRDAPCHEVPSRAPKGAPRVLALYTMRGGNTLLDRAIDPRRFRHYSLTLEFFPQGAAIPPHDVVWNAVGDAEFCAEALDLAEAVLRRSRAPVINPVATIRATGREHNANTLAGIPGLRVPRTASFLRERLAAAGGFAAWRAEAGLALPVLLRPQGSHGGDHLLKIDRDEDAAPSLAAVPGDSFLATEFVDSRLPDGKIRKFRAIYVAGRTYPLHAAVSPRWKIHYASADMKDRPEHQAEDRAFLEDPAAAVGTAAWDAVRIVGERLRLDYGGIDFGVLPGGEAVFYEANATMTVADPDPGAQWDYRRAPVTRVFDAIAEMVADRARRAR